MGLDMYLRAETYVGGWDHMPAADKAKFKAIADAVGIVPTERSPSFNVEATVGYWRKANAVHAWLVKNVQKGVDDCRKYYVSKEKLVELRADCMKVLESAETVPAKVPNGMVFDANGVTPLVRDGEAMTNPGMVAAKVLPTASGFFFGSTNYDEYYLQDLRDTVKIIDRVINDPALNGWDISYQSSW